MTTQPPRIVIHSPPPHSPQTSISGRSWNYLGTSVGENLKLLGTTHDDAFSRGSAETGCGDWNSAIRLRRRRLRLEHIMSRHDLVAHINLSSLDDLGGALGLEDSEVWLNYIDALLDMGYEDSMDDQAKRRIFYKAVGRLVEEVDDRQLVRLRLFFSQVERRFENLHGQAVAEHEPQPPSHEQQLQRLYLEGLRADVSTRNYCSSILMRGADGLSQYDCESRHAATYFIDVKLFKVKPLVSTYDGRDAIINIKFYGDELTDPEPYSCVRETATRCIQTIEARRQRRRRQENSSSP